ncbi:MAG: hypothetical protein AMXMBFR46_01370 [Acidimicrobiia bacterium]
MEPVGLSQHVAAGFLRVVTHPRIFREPTPTRVALQFVDAMRASPAVTAIDPGARHWGIFTGLCRSLGLRGNDVPDAFLAAIALEHGATWVTSDHGFGRFPGLRTARPEV